MAPKFKPEIKRTLSNLNTRTGVKEKKYHFEYWAGEGSFDWDWDRPDDGRCKPIENHLDKVLQLSNLRRAAANFVRILTGDDTIRVEYSNGKDSYTDGKTVVISAEDDPAKFDKTVATALHEAAHCLLSDFVFLTLALEDSKFFPSDLVQHPLYHSHILPAMKMILNVLEDRRIDEFVYRTAVGYRPYYNVLYQEIWNSPEVSKALRIKPEWRQPTWDTYLNRLINISNPAAWDTIDAVPGVREMYTLVDLPNIRRFTDEPNSYRSFMSARYIRTGRRRTPELIRDKPDINLVPDDWFGVNPNFGGVEILDTKLPNLFRVALQIVRVILANVVPESAPPSDTNPGPAQPAAADAGEDATAEGSNGLPNLDLDRGRSNSMPSTGIDKPGRLTKEQKKTVINEKKLAKELGKITKFLNKEERKKKISAKAAADVRAMDSSGAEIRAVGNDTIGRGRVLVTENCSSAIMLSDWWAFAHKQYDYYRYGMEPTRTELTSFNTECILQGMRMGQILAHRLAVRNEQTITRYPNQRSGRIDRRTLARLGMDIDTVFTRIVQDQYKPAMIHLSLDASGSMSGEAWNSAITTATALVYAATKISNLEVVVSLRGQLGTDIGTAHIAIVHDSRRHTFAHWRFLAQYFRPTGGTPEGLCFEAVMGHLLKDAADYSVYFVNISDGEPSFVCTAETKPRVRRGAQSGAGITYVGLKAWQHTRQQINIMRESGIRVLSYFVNRNAHGVTAAKDSFKMMYGEDASFITITQITSIVATMNKLLLKKM